MDYLTLRQKLSDGSNYKRRYEGQIVPQGLSLTSTNMADYWRWREGDTIFLLRIPHFGKERFLIENINDYVNNS